MIKHNPIKKKERKNNFAFIKKKDFGNLCKSRVSKTLTGDGN